jgi:HlyD family secretion protein
LQSAIGNRKSTIRKSAIRLLFLVALVVAAVLGVRVSLKGLETAKPEAVPTTKVVRGDLDLRVYATGEMQTTHRVMISAPPVSGGTLQILHVARSGNHVNSGDVVVAFDPSEQQFNMEQAQADMAQAQEEITKAKADAEVQAATDQVNLVKDKFDVRQAELDVSKNELVSAIDAKKNLLKLDEAKRVLAQLEEDIKSHAASSQAGIAVSEEKRNKAQLAIEQAKRNIDNMTVHAPMDGFVRVRENPQAAGGFFFTGMQIPEFRDGDQVWPGSTICEVLDTAHMELTAKVNESDRTNLKPGEKVQVRVDALGGVALDATVKTVAATASHEDWWSSSDSSQKFGATFDLAHPEPRLRPGFTAQLVIFSGQVQGAMLVPRQAVFVKEGKPVVYVKSGNSFSPHEVHIKAVNESRAAVDGLSEGAEVALVNPEEKAAKGPAAPSGPSMTVGGGR